MFALPSRKKLSSRHETGEASTTDALPVAPSMGPAIAAEEFHSRTSRVDGRVVTISGLAILVGLVAGIVAQVLTRLIGFLTNLSFYGRISTDWASPAYHHLGPWVIVVPVVGGLIVGLMARYGSTAIRGHGIPEAMEQVLVNESRIPARVTFLKPLSAAIAIGTGCPFGAEGPIIATGGALGSLVGQFVKITATERKTLLAAGAAAGMAATFGSPISAVLLAIELLLFEYRPRSLVPVALAACVATELRTDIVGAAPIFAMPNVMQPTDAALLAYIVIGAFLGIASVGVTRAVYKVEDLFARLPIHWMWWPAIGGLAVGVVGYVSPHTLGVGYENIEQIISGHAVAGAFLMMCALKFVSWAIALGSGTSGGTLAPLFTIGGGLGAALGSAAIWLFPGIGLDIRIAALVGMAAIFAGAARALLASVVFAFETTAQPHTLLPLLAGCASAYLVSCLMMRTSIMTEKIVRRGVRVVDEYAADFLDQLHVHDCATRPAVTVAADATVAHVRQWLESDARGTRHQAFPVLDRQERLVGVVTGREIREAPSTARRILDLVRREAIVIGEDNSLREAADVMAREDIGRLPVVAKGKPGILVGIITRSDLVGAHTRRLAEYRRTRLRPRR